MNLEELGLPTDFAPYHFIRQLGQGGMGATYLVENVRLGHRAVMKVVGRDAAERLRKEAEALRQLDHPNIVGMLDLGAMPDGRPFLVMEWVEGEDLSQVIRARTPLALQQVLGLARAVAGALGCAHQKGILHLDVKPSNILVPGQAGAYRFDAAKLLDFGVLEELQADTGQTRAGLMIGTPYYMSPEQVRGQALTPAADIFSLGVVMYEALSGRRPFEGKTPPEMFYALLSKEPERLEPPIPAPLADLVGRCLDKDPLKRPVSGTELALLIDRLRLTLGGATVTLTATAVLSGTPPPVAQEPMLITGQGAPPPSPWGPHAPGAPREQTLVGAPAALPAAPQPLIGRRGFLAGLAVVVLVLAITAAALYFRETAVTPRITQGGTTAHPPLPLQSVALDILLIGLGAALVVSGVVLGMAVRRHAARKRDDLSGEIAELLKGRGTRKALSKKLAAQVDQVIARCRMMDERFLGLTMRVMVEEYGHARSFDDGQKALMNAITILDRLGPRLSPWYVRHEKLVATGVSLVGIVSGLATAVQSVAKVWKGTP